LKIHSSFLNNIDYTIISIQVIQKSGEKFILFWYYTNWLFLSTRFEIAGVWRLDAPQAASCIA